MAAGDFGFLTLIQVFDGPDRYTEVRRLDTIPRDHTGLQITSHRDPVVVNVLDACARIATA